MAKTLIILNVITKPKCSNYKVYYKKNNFKSKILKSNRPPKVVKSWKCHQVFHQEYRNRKLRKIYLLRS